MQELQDLPRLEKEAKEKREAELKKSRMGRTLLFLKKNVGTIIAIAIGSYIGMTGRVSKGHDDTPDDYDSPIKGWKPNYLTCNSCGKSDESVKTYPLKNSQYKYQNLCNDCR